MNVIASAGRTDYIRQQYAGHFKRPEDGKEPYAHVNEQKLDSTWEQEERSVYVDNNRTLTFKIGPAGSDFPDLLDSDAGVKVDSEKTGYARNREADQLHYQYDRNGKSQNTTETQGFIDQWA